MEGQVSDEEKAGHEQAKSKSRKTEAHRSADGEEQHSNGKGIWTSLGRTAGENSD
jgi:hypothetical protein